MTLPHRRIVSVVSLDWMKLMADAKPPPLATARSFPDRVPILSDAETGVTLRAPGRGDLPGMVEQCRDPEMIRWTSVPTPEEGYQLRDAEEFLALTAAGWTSGQRLGWTIEAQQAPNVASAAASTFTWKGTGSPMLALACIRRRVAARS